MRAENLPALDTYIQDHIGTKTTRHASEESLRCPPLADAVDAERNMRTTLHVMFDRLVSVENAHEATGPISDLDRIKDLYWEGARHATAAHGAKPDFALDDYFHVAQDRSYRAIRASVLEKYPAGSVPVRMFGSLDAYQQALSLDAVSSSRILTTLFSSCLPSIKKHAALYEAGGDRPTIATSKAIADFTATTVPEHIADLKCRADAGQSIRAFINKRSLYPQPIDGTEYDDQPLRISHSEAEGFTKVYRMQERPYSDEELRVAEILMQTPAMQRSILLFHIGMVDYAANYLGAHPERAKHSLEPFTEIFISCENQATGELSLIPNPKLIKVIGNNTMPAIARVLIENGRRIEDMTGSHIQQGIELAKNLRVFQTQIGQFNNYDPTTDTVELTSIFMRTCPAMQMFSEALTKRLPDLYDSCR